MTGTDPVTGAYLYNQPLPTTWERWVHCDFPMTTVQLKEKKRFITIEWVISDYKSHPSNTPKKWKEAAYPDLLLVPR